MIGGTLFNHRDIHKYTWESPDSNTRNQIDHVAVSRKWIGSLKDVRMKRGADINSNHVLVLAKVRLSLRAKRKEVGRRKLDVGRLKEERVQEEFKLTIFNRFEVLKDKELESIDEYWMEYRDAMKETGEEVLGFKKRVRKEWISGESWARKGERKDLKREINRENIEVTVRDGWKQQYREKDREVKASVRRDKRRFLDEKAAEAEEAARH